MFRRKADYIIIHDTEPYVYRWYLIPRNQWFNIYLHRIVRSDHERALHDHPSWNISIILKGGYIEVVPDKDGDVGTTQSFWRGPGSILFRRADEAHRLELPVHRSAGPAEAWTIWISGPKTRTWGFHCRDGWRPADQVVHLTPTGSYTKQGVDCS